MTSHDATDADLTVPAKHAYLVFFDSTDLHWCPEVGYSYVLLGEQMKVESPGVENPWCALFGSLLYPTGEGLYTIHERKRHQEVKVHLGLLMERDPEAFWFVVMDNASAHTTPKLEEFWETHKERIEQVLLPTYSPHLNFIERLWRFMRGEMTRNQFYESLPAQCQAIAQWLETLPFSRFCSLMGINELELIFVTKN